MVGEGEQGLKVPFNERPLTVVMVNKVFMLGEDFAVPPGTIVWASVADEKGCVSGCNAFVTREVYGVVKGTQTRNPANPEEEGDFLSIEPETYNHDGKILRSLFRRRRVRKNSDIVETDDPLASDVFDESNRLVVRVLSQG
ncbi:hypothetical protein ACFLZP_02625 [Patescibacteria group bacterium]